MWAILSNENTPKLGWKLEQGWVMNRKTCSMYEMNARWPRLLWRTNRSGVATGGSGGSMNLGPRAPVGPRARHKKIKQENNRHRPTSEKKTNNQSLYQRQLCKSKRAVSTSMTFLVCVCSLIVVLTAEMWMFQFVYFFNVVKHLYFAHLFFSRNLR